MPVVISIKGAVIDQSGNGKNIGLIDPVTIAPTGLGMSHRQCVVLPSPTGTEIWDSTITSQVKTNILSITIVNKSTSDYLTLEWYAGSSSANKITSYLQPGGMFHCTDITASKTFKAFTSNATSSLAEVIITSY